MEKKKYVAPNMEVVELKHHPRLLDSSQEPDPQDPEQQGYIPNMGNDELNKLA